jgi:uncharacterized membrane protein YheB (UPF0754 family)
MNPLFVIVASLTHVAESLPGSVATVAGYFAWWEWSLLLIPPISGIIGYITNWVVIYLMFHPLYFKGVDVPGMEHITSKGPYRLRQLPGMLQGQLGWQGIIPAKARKIGSINVDKAVSNLATQEEFHEEFDPDRIAEYIYENSGEEIREMVVETIREENPELWDNAPEQAREAIRQRVDDQLPEITCHIMHRIGEHVDEILDIKMMVIEHFEENPDDMNAIFLETGDKEFDFIINSGFYVGTLLGLFAIPMYVFIDAWWVLPLFGVFVGYATNWLALKMIFRPVERRKIGPFTLHGIFMRRQDAVSETYARIISSRVITLENIADNLMNGPKSDRGRKMIKEDLKDSIDEMFGEDSPVVRMMGGSEEYEQIRDQIAENSVETAVEPMGDEEIHEERRSAIQRLVASRMKELSPAKYVVRLRSAFKEDEWILIMTGTVLGFVAGWIQLLVVTAV